MCGTHFPSASMLGGPAPQVPRTAGVLTSAVPCLAGLLTLRRVPANTSGLFMSVNPVPAAVAGRLVLGEGLGAWEWAGIAAVGTANAVSMAARRTRARPGPRRTPRRVRAGRPDRSFVGRPVRAVGNGTARPAGPAERSGRVRDEVSGRRGRSRTLCRHRGGGAAG